MGLGELVIVSKFHMEAVEYIPRGIATQKTEKVSHKHPSLQGIKNTVANFLTSHRLHNVTKFSAIHCKPFQERTGNKKNKH